jgi:predicted XRE-type DNA-binding protein
MIEVEQSSGNIYADLGVVNAEEMLLKARLASKIGDIIKHRQLTQQQAAKVLGLSQAKISNLLRGNFRSISEVKMLECLNRLGRDVQIIVREVPDNQNIGHTEVVFA